MAPDFSGTKAGSNYANLIHLAPPIVVGWTGQLFPFGSASVLAPLFTRRRLVFLVNAKWSFADEDEARALAAAALPFMAAHHQHRFEWICNIDEETERLRALGLSAHTHNQNMLLREDVFRPLEHFPATPIQSSGLGNAQIQQFRPLPDRKTAYPFPGSGLDGVASAYDAIYNARISHEKRNELAAEIDRVAFITYRDPGAHSVEAFHAACAELARRVPGGRLLNSLTETGSARLSPAEVNRAYAQADVGLCLSPREGAMRVAGEYQMAGLPVVATPCRGGRDHYFDPETWIMVPPDPRAVREAVDAMRARAIPRQWVRQRTLERVERDRRRFIDFVQSIIDEEGGEGTFEPAFHRLWRGNLFERWLPMRDFAAETWAALGGD